MVGVKNMSYCGLPGHFWKAMGGGVTTGGILENMGGWEGIFSRTVIFLFLTVSLYMAYLLLMWMDGWAFVIVDFLVKILFLDSFVLNYLIFLILFLR